MTLPVILLIMLSYTFTFVNGIHDGCNVVATIVASRSMQPKKALAIAALTEFISPMVLGTAVASTIGKGIVKFDSIQSQGKVTAYIFVACAVLGAIIWNLITWKLALPSSSSHALIGGLIGSGMRLFGAGSIQWLNILTKVILMIFLTPVIGFIIGYCFMVITNRICVRFSCRINKFFKVAQTFSMILLAASHSTNDSQKSMGIVTLILVICGAQNEFYVPFWVVFVSALLISIGLSVGGWKIVKTVGRGIFRLKPVHSFVSQVSAGSVILASGLLGSPVSTSQIVSASIMGVGAGEKMNGVNWSIVKNIIISWITTIPAAALISACLYSLVTRY